MTYYSTIFNIECSDADLMQPARELLADALGDAGYESFEDKPEGLAGYIQEDQYDEATVREAVQSVPLEGIKVTFSTSTLPDTNWNALWEEEGFAPITVAGFTHPQQRLLTIYDARHTDADTLSTPINIGIAATNAFGTGNHETTRLVASTLLELQMAGKRVLDCGCGTGILAITALRCGAKEAVAYDIDEWSTRNTKENAKLNGVDDRIEVLCGDAHVLSHIEGIFDVVMANINRNILLGDLPYYCEVLSRDGIIILSGFYESDADMLREEATGLGLHEAFPPRTDGDWCCLAFRR
jgi:ribosomal protein L11 methyltransferase